MLHCHFHLHVHFQMQQGILLAFLLIWHVQGSLDLRKVLSQVYDHFLHRKHGNRRIDHLSVHCKSSSIGSLQQHALGDRRGSRCPLAPTHHTRLCRTLHDERVPQVQREENLSEPTTKI